MGAIVAAALLAGCVDSGEGDGSGPIDVVEPTGPCAHLFRDDVADQVLARIVYDQDYNNPPARDQYEGRLWDVAEEPAILLQEVDVYADGCFRIEPPGEGEYGANALYNRESQSWGTRTKTFTFTSGFMELPDQAIEVADA